ncbi:MAG: hypothetical protein AB8H47_12210 [Bacteroidia bacterium]
MNNSRIIGLLQTFSATEMRRLGEFVRSPYFNKHEGVLALFAVLEAAYPDFSSSSLDRERLCQCLLSHVISLQQLQDITSYLTRLLERFLAQERWESQPLQRQGQLVFSLRERKMSKEHLRAYIKWQKLLPKPQSVSEYLDYYHIEEEGMHTQVLERKRKTAPHLQKAIQAFDHYYLLNRLRYACALLNRRIVLADEAELSWARQLYHHINENRTQWQTHPLIVAYHQLFHLLDHEGEDEFRAIEEHLEAHLSLISPASLRELYAHLMNFCIKKLNEGNQDYQARLFALYQDQLAQGILLDEGQISPADYKNIVSLALRNEAFDWVGAFIEDYKNKLPPDRQEVAYRYQKANLHFHLADYSSCLRLLRTQEFEDSYYQLGAKTMVLKVHFETGDFEAFYYAAAAFESFLQRNRKIPAYQKELYLNLIRFSKRLAKLYIQHQIGSSMLKKAQLLRLDKRLSKHRKIAQSAWILSKMDRLLVQQGIFSDS